MASNSWRSDLASCWNHLVNELVVEPILDALFTQNRITKEKKEEIQAGTAQKQQAETLLHAVYDSDEDTFQGFIKALTSSGQGHLVEYICGNGQLKLFMSVSNFISSSSHMLRGHHVTQIK